MWESDNLETREGHREIVYVSRPAEGHIDTATYLFDKHQGTSNRNTQASRTKPIRNSQTQ
jgi:hypothetical protein